MRQVVARVASVGCVE